MRTPRDFCPQGVSTATVSAQEREQGAALLFTTSGDVEALRRAVATLAPPPGLSTTRARLDKVRNGIRLVFDADAPAESEKLQAAVARHAEALARRCHLVPTEPVEPNIEADGGYTPVLPPAITTRPSSPPPTAPTQSTDAGARERQANPDAATPPAQPTPNENEPREDKSKPASPADKVDAGDHLPDASSGH